MQGTVFGTGGITVNCADPVTRLMETQTGKCPLDVYHLEFLGALPGAISVEQWA